MWFTKLLRLIDDLIVNLFPRPAYDCDPKDLPMNQPPEPQKAPVVAPKPEKEVLPTPAPKQSLLEQFCHAIKEYEGWGPPGSTVNGVYYPQGTASYRRNNPGNCRYSSVGYHSMYGKVGRSENNFAIFKDYATGWLYLRNLILSKVRKNPDQTILDFMKVYAPTSDGNDPTLYAKYIAKRLGVSITTPMKLIV